jgi:threonine dehydratase
VQANIQEIVHQRAFTNLPVQAVAVDLVLETRGPEHVRQVIDALGKLGFTAKLRLD